MGDFNSGILFKGKPMDQTRQGKRLLQVTNCHGVKDIINSPTRICGFMEGSLDLIFVNNVRKIPNSRTFTPNISDHKHI